MTLDYLVKALAEARTRQSWNDRLEHWAKPASASEEVMIERAATMVRDIMGRNEHFEAEGVRIMPQGSYFNNTNVRQEADMDLRAVHPLIYVEYAPEVRVDIADKVLGYSSTGRTFGEVANEMRNEIVQEMTAEFGASNVDASGNKAIRVKRSAGSRADVDIVPCFVFRHVWWNGARGRYDQIEGVKILSRHGVRTFNFPDQHYANGIAKRGSTRLRFKKNVRMLKRLRDELVEAKQLAAGEIPSFLIESLVYSVEDEFFLVETDDRYGRLLRVVARIHHNLNDTAWVASATEINGIKTLFGAHQPWTPDIARKFTAAAWNRLLA